MTKREQEPLLLHPLQERVRMKVFLGTDHAGLALKEDIKSFLKAAGYVVIDCGAYGFDPDDDYPDFVSKAATGVAGEPPTSGSKGIVFGKSGAGECIVANKIKGIRAALGFNECNVELARTHNDANVLCLGSDFVGPEAARALVKLFLETPFSGEQRHVKRIEKIRRIEYASRCNPSRR